jgi:hypothetical protein
MPTFKPFRGVRPHNDFVDVFPTHPIENFSQEEINKKAAEDSSYIQMIKPYVCSKSKDVDRNLRKVRTNYEEMLQKISWFRILPAIIFMNKFYPTKQSLEDY